MGVGIRGERDGLGPERPQPRTAFLDGVRALAALAVVAHHIWLTAYPPKLPPDGVLRAFTGWLAFGQFAVPAFIVVSGYSLTLSALKRERPIVEFLLRRFKRIVIPYWGALLVSLLLAETLISSPTGSAWDLALGFDVKAVALHLLLLQDLRDAYAINYPLWTVAIEWHVYFVFPLLLIAVRRGGLVATIVIVTIASCLLAFVVPEEGAISSHGASLFEHAPLLVCFVLGVGACLLARSEASLASRLSPFLATAMCIAIVAACFALGRLPVLEHLPEFEIPVGVAVAAFALACATGRAPVARRVLELRILLWVGLTPYSLYLIHAPVVQIAWQRILEPIGVERSTPTGLLSLLLVGSALALLASWAFFQLVERRCMPRTMRAAEADELEHAGAPKALPVTAP